MTTLIPILGDQLSFNLSSLQGADPAQSVLLMMEVSDETNYVSHHKRKIAFLFSAMRHHAEALRAAGWTVDYVKLTDRGNSGSFSGEVAAAIRRHSPSSLVVTQAGEWRVQAMLDSWEDMFGLPVEIRPDTRFITPPGFFDRWADGKKQLRMEFFYREMRQLTGLLMDDGKPEGGQWNYDKENRKPAENDLLMPQLPHFPPDDITTEVLELVADRFGKHVGRLDDFGIAVTVEQAVETQRHFLSHALPRFGDYQDAMLTGEPYLYHAHLSFYMNAGLIDALDLCRKAEAEYRAGRAPLNAVEGFIRQIIGWREYMRGIYWWSGPEYGQRNFFNASRRLPGWYWTGETDMHCLRQVIGQTLDLAYAHHIQRLMITGNFALLIGADPDDVDRWYLEVYADAYEWVEQPNTRGMSQFADGGLLGSKPYASSGAYINRMSDYCGHCRYDVTQKIGPDACPFNSLYWDFLARNRDKLGNNKRLQMPYRSWDRMKEKTQAELRAQAAGFLKALDAEPAGY